MGPNDIERDTRDFLVSNYLFGRSEQLGADDALLGKVIDSTGVLTLVAFLEEKYAITVPDDDVIPDNLDSVNKITAYVSRRLMITT